MKRTERKKRRSLLGDESGGAVLEFAVISVVMITMLLWSHVFFDVIQVRMKLLEAARTAVFEFTAYELSDYNTGTQQGHQDRFNNTLDTVKKDIQDIYKNDLDSLYKYKKQKIATKRMTLDTLTINDVDIREETEFNQSLLSFLNFFTSIPTFDSFNRRGYVRATASANFTSMFAPNDAKWVFGSEIKKNALTKSMTQTVYLLVDSWKLEDGCNVNPDGTYMTEGASQACLSRAGGGTTAGESLFKKEVSRLAFFKVGEFDMGLLGGSFKSGVNLNPFQVRTASVKFQAGQLETGMTTSPGKDGQTHLNVSTGGEMGFYTAPFCTSGTGIGGPCSGTYVNAYNTRGDFFMGCPKEQAGKKDSQGQGQSNSYGQCQYTQTAGP